MNLIKKENRNTSEVTGYRPEIDGLRAFAVIAVIINHFNKNLLPSGYLGVDIFFVISGFVITSSVSKRKIFQFKDFITDFYERRFKRLIPALVFYVIISSLLICLFNSDPSISLKTGFFSLFGLSNIYLIHTSADYFAINQSLNPFTQTWSLAVEEQFYIIFPILVFFSGITRQMKYGFRNLKLILLFLYILSLTIFIFSYLSNPISSYYLMPARFWEIASGCLFYLFLQEQSPLLKKLENLPSSILLISICILMCLPNKFTIFSIIFVVIFSNLLIISLNKKSNIFKFLTNKIVLHIGLISYSLYLWHWGILSISQYTIGIHWWSIPIQLSIIYYLSLFSYKYIETPFRRKVWADYKWMTIMKGLFIINLSALTLIVLDKSLKTKVFLGDKKAINNYSEDRYWNRKLCKNDALANKEMIFNNDVFNNCWFKSNKSSEKIEFKVKKLFFFGDSYSEQLMPIASKIFENRSDLKINSFYNRNCSILSSSIVIEKEKDLNCGIALREYINFFKNYSDRGDILIIASPNRFSPPFKSPDSKFIYNGNPIEDRLAENLYLEELKDLSNELIDQGKKLAITSPIPIIKNNPAICINWFSRFNNKCKRINIFDLKANEISKQNLKKYLILEQYGVIYLDMYSILDKVLVSNKSNIYNFFYNKNHISKTGALELVNYFKNKLIY